MTLFKSGRRLLVGALAMGLLSGVGHARDYHEAKLAAIGHAAEAASHEEAVLRDAAARAHALTEVGFHGGDGEAALAVQLAGAPPVRYFTTEEDGAFVVDLYDTVNLAAGVELNGPEETGVGAVRTSLYALEPQLISRVVVELDGAPAPRLEQTGGALRMVFGGSDNDSPAVAAARALDRELQADGWAAARHASAVDEAHARARFRAGQLEDALRTHEREARRVLDEGERFVRSASESAGADELEDGVAALRTALREHEALWAEFRAAAETFEGQRGMVSGRAREIDRQVESQRQFLAAILNGGEANANSANAVIERIDGLRGQLVADPLEELAQHRDACAEALRDHEELLTNLAAADGDLAARAAALRDLVERRGVPAEPTPDGGAPREQLAALGEALARAPETLSGSAETAQDSRAAARSAEAWLANGAGAETASTAEPLSGNGVVAPADPDAEDAAYTPAWEGRRPDGVRLATFYQEATATRRESRDARLQELSGQLEAVRAARVDVPLQQPRRLAAAVEPPEGEEWDPADWHLDHLSDYDEEPGANDLDAPPPPVEPEPAPADLNGEETEIFSPDDPEWELPVEDDPALEDMPPPIVDAEPDADAPSPPPAVLETMPAPADARPRYDPNDDPLNQLVNIDFRQMEMANVVALLAQRAQVNVIAGAELTGTVTANLRNVPLRQAMEVVLQMNGLGIVEEAGVFRIVPYNEAQAANRVTEMVYLDHADIQEVRDTLESVAMGDRDSQLMSFTANEASSVIIIAGPPRRVDYYADLAVELDVREPDLPTVTEVLRLNYLEPTEVQPIVTSMLSQDVGQVEMDVRGRNLIVTDMPMVVERIRGMLESIDSPVKQVAIEALIVDAVLRDASETGVNWMLDILRRHNRRGQVVGHLEELSFDATLGNIGAESLNAGILNFGVLSSRVDFRGAIAAEVQSSNAEILANPVVVTVENKMADISIVQEFPYQQITQATTGPPISSTEFKDIGVTLEVTPRVTHDNDILADVTAKQSSISGMTPDGVPIEDMREASTSLRTGNGQTIFIGGLRNISDRIDVSRVPVLGDIPVINFMFRQTQVEKIHTELMVFLTCRVLEDLPPELTERQQHRYNLMDEVPEVPNAQRDMFRSIVNPSEVREPVWRRGTE